MTAPFYYRSSDTFIPPDVQSSNLQQEGTVPRPKKNKGYTPPEAQPYVGIRTACQMLGLSKSGLMKTIRAGKLPSAYQLDDGGHWIMLESDVIQLQNERNRNAE